MLSILSTVWSSDFNHAVEDYEEGMYESALRTFYSLAQNDDDKAQYNLALMHANGLGTQIDNKNAKKWYEKAARQGNASAQYNLAQLYTTLKNSDEQAYVKAKYWYEKAIAGGIDDAYNNLASLYMQGLGTKQDKNKAFELFKMGAKKGDSTAQVNVAVLYAWGEGISHNKMEAYVNFKKALQSGKSEASEYLDKLCQESAWVCKD